MTVEFKRFQDGRCGPILGICMDCKAICKPNLACCLCGRFICDQSDQGEDKEAAAKKEKRRATLERKRMDRMIEDL